MRDMKKCSSPSTAITRLREKNLPNWLAEQLDQDISGTLTNYAMLIEVAKCFDYKKFELLPSQDLITICKYLNDVKSQTPVGRQQVIKESAKHGITNKHFLANSLPKENVLYSDDITQTLTSLENRLLDERRFLNVYIQPYSLSTGQITTMGMKNYYNLMFMLEAERPKSSSSSNRENLARVQLTFCADQKGKLNVLISNLQKFYRSEFLTSADKYVRRTYSKWGKWILDYVIDSSEKAKELGFSTVLLPTPDTINSACKQRLPRESLEYDYEKLPLDYGFDSPLYFDLRLISNREMTWNGTFWIKRL